MKIPPPRHDVKEEIAVMPKEAYVEWYLNVPPWVCKKCRLTNFGRNRYCAACKEANNEGRSE